MKSKNELIKENEALRKELAATKKKLAKANENYETSQLFERRKQNKIEKLEREMEELKQYTRKIENGLNALKSALIAKGLYKEVVKEVA